MWSYRERRILFSNKKLVQGIGTGDKYSYIICMRKQIKNKETMMSKKNGDSRGRGPNCPPTDGPAVS